MKLAANKNFNINTSFKAAMVNINALSDVHGHINLADSAFQELNDRKADVFCKEEKGKANVLAICGDWFIDGEKKGYYSAPERERAFFQKDILSAFIEQIKELAPHITTLFTPGNHEFDGGVPLLDKILSSLDSEILMTNLHLPTSNGFAKTKKANKLINQKILEVEDDKDANLKHKVLFLGVSPINLRKYQKKCDGVNLLENYNVAQAKLQEHHYQATLSDCQNRIENFKRDNPNGVVILMSHTGADFSDNLAKRAQVDFVLDGHEHKEQIRYSNKTPIIPLSQNFNKIVNLKIKFDDMGNFSSYELKSFNPLSNKKKGKLSELYNSIFQKDIQPKYTICVNNPSINELGLENIRESNSFLANFITDSLLEEIRKEQPSVDFLGLNSAAIRGGLKVSETASISHTDLMNVLSGIKEKEGQIMITRMTGKDVLDLVLDNVLFNSVDPKKNPIMQYSGLEIDKTSILKSYEMGYEAQDLSEFIIDTNTGRPIDINKEYTFANTEKFFDKSDNSQIKKMKNKSYKLGYNVQTLFERHFESAKNGLFAKCDVRYK